MRNTDHHPTPLLSFFWDGGERGEVNECKEGEDHKREKIEQEKERERIEKYKEREIGGIRERWRRVREQES